MNKNSIRVLIVNGQNGEQIFKTIIAHPMETGLRRNKKTGGKIPADYIKDFQIRVDGETYFEMVLGEFVSKNPFITFRFTKHVIENQLMQISWIDNHKKEITYDYVVGNTQGGRLNFRGEKKGSEVMPLLPEAGPACKTNTSAD